MKMFTRLTLSASFVLTASSAFAGQSGGTFVCYTTSLPAGQNVAVHGKVDGEANVEELFMMTVDGDDTRNYLEVNEISFLDSFRLVAHDPQDSEDPTHITIQSRSLGKSSARFVIRNGEAVVKAKGRCDVRFRSAI